MKPPAREMAVLGEYARGYAYASTGHRAAPGNVAESLGLLLEAAFLAGAVVGWRRRIVAATRARRRQARPGMPAGWPRRR